MYYLFNTLFKILFLLFIILNSPLKHTLLFAVLEVKKSQGRGHIGNERGFVGGVLDHSFSDQDHLVEWVVCQCSLVFLLDVGIHLSWC